MDRRVKKKDNDDTSGKERPTLKTLAFMTGLGVTTVSRALKDAPEIGAETRRRVQLRGTDRQSCGVDDCATSARDERPVY